MRALAAVVICLWSVAAFAQAQPFDMTPEKSVVDPPAVAAPTTAEPPEAASAPVPEAPLAAPATQPAATETADVRFQRNIVPFRELALSGENDRRAWSLYLTPEQAASAATLHIGYSNAVVVAPETSLLDVAINGVSVIKKPIASPGSEAELDAEIPQGVLKPGQNTFSVTSAMRHRTDCTIESTYELWTDIDPSKTYLAFADPAAARFRRLEDVGAIGVNQKGETIFNIVVPALDQSITTATTVQLGEALAIAASMPNQSFTVSREPLPGLGLGSLTVFLGTVEELANVAPQLPAAAAASPIASFVEDPGSQAPALVVSGPSWQSLEIAVQGFAASLDRPLDVRRTMLPTHNWHAPDAPLLFESSQKSFAELGVATQEFAGRRFRTEFALGVPSDFYANEYGEATILLDAAYSDQVLPGSHIDIYVNSDIAATVPVTQSGGAILRHFPVGVTMRHLRPGPNLIAIEAVLLTDADNVCAAGAPANKEPRFVLFDSSQFSMPDFARVARQPDLASLAGTGFPYNRSPNAVALFMAHNQPQTLSAAVTLLAQISVAAGRSIAVTTTASPAAADRNAIFVGTIADMQPQVMAQVGLSEETRRVWSDGMATSAVNGGRPETDATFERWRDELSGRGWRGRVSSLEDWLSRKFDLSFGSLRIFPGANAEYVPERGTPLVVAQQVSPTSQQTWTVVAAPTAEDLTDGVNALTAQGNWARIGGRISALDPTLLAVSTVSADNFSFVETQPFSLRNYRLIAANWLSGNPLSYAGVLFVACLMLGLATARLLSRLGRHP